MPLTYAVLGAGRQGTAAAYDLARWGNAGRVVVADRELEVARRASKRVNDLLGTGVVVPAQLDVTDASAVTALLSGVDAFLSAVPYSLNLEIARAAVAARASMCDLGGHTGIARQQHGLDQPARAAGISIIPNCGQVPGLGTTLMVHAIELLDTARDVFMWDGGIPQRPREPFPYLLTFNVAGLTNEYAEPAIFLRDGRITEVAPLSELETLEFAEPIGRLEAFVTGGGTDTMPWTFEGRLRTLQNKTLRHPGHFAQLKAFHDLGLMSLESLRLGETEVVPRDVFHRLFEPKVTFAGDKDSVIVRVRASGRKNGRDAEAVVEFIDHFDETTGFTAMERSTGWSAAIVAAMMAQGRTPRGAGGVESQVPAGLFVEQLRRRGLSVTERLVLSDR
jgi:lysine 6-dehydrogenase